VSTVSNPATPLVVAVEGLSFAGKTTLVHALASVRGALALPEYCQLAPLPPFPPRDRCDVAKALEHFLSLEHHRARTAPAAGHPVVVLDRSPLTLISYEIGIAELGVPTDPELAVRLYSDAVDTGLVLAPHGYLYLRVPDAVTAARQACRGQVAAHLADPRVRTGIERANLQYLTTLPARRWLDLDGTRPVDQLTADVAAFVEQLAQLPGPAPTWRVITDTEPA